MIKLAVCHGFIEEEDLHRQLGPFRGSSSPFGALSWRGLNPI